MTRLVLFQVLLLVGLLSAHKFLGYPEYCLHDPDYEELLKIIQDGLGRAGTPAHVVVVGAGISGLTAAKLLHEAGHKGWKVEKGLQGRKVEKGLQGRKVEKGLQGRKVEKGLQGRKVEKGLQGRKVEKGLQGRKVEKGLQGRKVEKGLQGRKVEKVLQGLVLEVIRQFGLKLSPFQVRDPNAWYLINGTRIRAGEVEKNPDVLNYPVKPSEKGKSPTQLYREALDKALQKFQSVDCKKFLAEHDSFSTKEYLIKVGNLSRGAVQMIGDLMNEDSGFYLSFLASLWDFGVFSSERFFEITGGFDQLPKAFLKALPDVVRFNCTVEKIMTQDNQVQVFYRAPDTLAPSRISADYVLVTSTAKATRHIHFHPPLSPPKTQALRSIHYAGATKIILVCSQKFWEQDGIRGGPSITDHPSRFIYYPNHNFSSGVGVILASYTWNEDSLFFLSLSDQACLDVVYQDLAEIHQLNKDFLQEICDRYVIHKWELDQHSMGAFAAFTPFQFVDYSQELFQPEGRVHFAGEHVAQPHGWLETAVKSAVRAASNILHQAQVEEEEEEKMGTFLPMEDL
ncbi:PREDICTED: L-amino-acid oxidase [Chaetura pelagica]|uniref:L-amino-acid oxidase n=1 Tax=Chaetura pelagica TaxID=8897 RepID=UPI000523DD8F|nr:PREDICTED: L-amino-acid oxidase [Chaetura pelagica]